MFHSNSEPLRLKAHMAEVPPIRGYLQPTEVFRGHIAPQADLTGRLQEVP